MTPIQMVGIFRVKSSSGLFAGIVNTVSATANSRKCLLNGASMLTTPRFIVGFSAMRLKWKSACDGTGVIRPTCVPDIWMKPTSKSVANGLICTGPSTATVERLIFIFRLGVILKRLIDF